MIGKEMESTIIGKNIQINGVWPGIADHPTHVKYPWDVMPEHLIGTLKIDGLPVNKIHPIKENVHGVHQNVPEDWT